MLAFTSDHGDMLDSQGYFRKQKPWDESIKVPFLLKFPALNGSAGKVIEMPINSPDIMPTLLGLCGIDIPGTVEEYDFSNVLRGSEKPWYYTVLLMIPWTFAKYRLAEFRGIRTEQYTYVKKHDGPWLLYNNREDRYQLNNLCGKPKHAKLQETLESTLQHRLKETGDEFLPGIEYIEKVALYG